MQGVRGGEDRDALILVQIEQVAIARDDEVGLGGERASEHMVVIRITAGWGRQRLWLDDLRQAGVVLHELCGGQSCGEHPLREFIPRDDLGELGQEGGASAGCENALAGEIHQATWRPLPEQARQDGWCQRRSA